MAATDLTGYAEWSQGTNWIPVDDSGAATEWPSAQYHLRDGIEKLRVAVVLERAAQAQQPWLVREVRVAKPPGQPIGVDLTESGMVPNLEVVGVGGPSAGLEDLIGWCVTHVDGIPVDTLLTFEAATLGSAQPKMRFVSHKPEEAGVAVDSRVVRWQEKLLHPSEMIELMEWQSDNTAVLSQWYQHPEGDEPFPGFHKKRVQLEGLHATLHRYQPVLRVGVHEDLLRELQGIYASGEVRKADLLQHPAEEVRRMAEGVTGEGDVAVPWETVIAQLGESHDRVITDPQQKFEHLVANTVVCTFVADDGFVDPSLTEPLTTDYDECHTAEDLHLRKHNVPSIVGETAEGPVMPWSPLAGKLSGGDGEKMWIVAAFGQAMRSQQTGRMVWQSEGDRVLARLEARDSNLVVIQPPLSGLGTRREEFGKHRRLPYLLRLVTRGDAMRYRYCVELHDDEASEEGPRSTSQGGSDTSSMMLGINRSEEEERREMFFRVLSAHHKQLHATRKEEPETHLRLVVPQGDARVHFFGEIISAEGFEASNVFVRFESRLPKGSSWRLHTPEEIPLSNFTQTSRVSRVRAPEGHHTTFFAFGMPFELHCTGRLGESTQHPRLLLQVYSEKSTRAQLLEGYGSVDLAPTPGMHRTTVRCWKPVHSIRRNLREFFVGESAELDDLSYTSVPDTFSGSFLNKFGFCTTTTGCIEVRWNCLVHCEGCEWMDGT